ncbi:hypothetical protein B0H13DRAFT_2652671 [Mycena leptocephala]|nr:hypothetical protein B0H13DRAFT_2652671 [Mycena leptocephala]
MPYLYGHQMARKAIGPWDRLSFEAKERPDRWAPTHDERMAEVVVAMRSFKPCFETDHNAKSKKKAGERRGKKDAEKENVALGEEKASRIKGISGSNGNKGKTTSAFKTHVGKVKESKDKTGGQIPSASVPEANVRANSNANVDTNANVPVTSTAGLKSGEDDDLKFHNTLAKALSDVPRDVPSPIPPVNVPVAKPPAKTWAELCAAANSAASAHAPTPQEREAHFLDSFASLSLGPESGRVSSVSDPDVDMLEVDPDVDMPDAEPELEERRLPSFVPPFRSSVPRRNSGLFILPTPGRYTARRFVSTPAPVFPRAPVPPSPCSPTVSARVSAPSVPSVRRAPVVPPQPPAVPIQVSTPARVPIRHPVPAPAPASVPVQPVDNKGFVRKIVTAGLVVAFLALNGL